MDMKKLVVPFCVKNMEEDDKFFHIHGYANTWDIDLGSDRSIRGCFNDSISALKANAQSIYDSDFKALIPALWQHNANEPIGVHVDMYEDEKGLFSHSIYPKDDSFVRERLIPQVRVGSVRKMSIGYIAEKFSFEDVDGRSVRNLEKVSLMETSPVTFPMNPGATMSDFKRATTFQDLPLAEEDRSWDSTAAQSRVREFLDSEDEPSSSYRRAFFWYDSEDPDTFGSYKLPFADVVDDRLVAVPRGVFAAAAAIRGARGGVNIPEADRNAVESHINRYYSKMDRESPFEDGKNILVLGIDELKSLSTRELDAVLRNGVRVTRNATKTLMSCLDVDSLRDVEDGTARDVKNGSDSKTEAKLDELLQILGK